MFRCFAFFLSFILAVGVNFNRLQVKYAPSCSEKTITGIIICRKSATAFLTSFVNTKDDMVT